MIPSMKKKLRLLAKENNTKKMRYGAITTINTMDDNYQLLFNGSVKFIG